MKINKENQVHAYTKYRLQDKESVRASERKRERDEREKGRGTVRDM